MKEDKSTENITQKLNEVMEELDARKKLVISPDSVMNKKMEALEGKNRI